MLELLAVPFLACLVLTGIHVYLGLHVLARGVIFVDLALAQIAALGLSVAVLAGHPIQSDAAYWYALTFTVGELFVMSTVVGDSERLWNCGGDASCVLVTAIGASSPAAATAAAEVYETLFQTVSYASR